MCLSAVKLNCICNCLGCCTNELSVLTMPGGWRARPIGNCDHRPHNCSLSSPYQASDLQHPPFRWLEPWGVIKEPILFWNTFFLLLRKRQTQPPSWSRLSGDWERFMSAIKWGVLQDMKYCCSTRKKPRLLILFHVIEFFLIQKLPMLVITDQTGRKLTFASCISTPHHPPPHGEGCPSLACILSRLF